MKRVLLLCCLLPVAIAAFANDLPLGHRDFYPSPERPVGFHGDGSRRFPGAESVTSWGPGKNICWSVALPGASEARDHEEGQEGEMGHHEGSRRVCRGGRSPWSLLELNGRRLCHALQRRAQRVRGLPGRRRRNRGQDDRHQTREDRTGRHHRQGPVE